VTIVSMPSWILRWMPEVSHKAARCLQMAGLSDFPVPSHALASGRILMGLGRIVSRSRTQIWQLQSKNWHNCWGRVNIN
jgi:hypothetical protein